MIRIKHLHIFFSKSNTKTHHAEKKLINSKQLTVPSFFEIHKWSEYFILSMRKSLFSVSIKNAKFRHYSRFEKYQLLVNILLLNTVYYSFDKYLKKKSENSHIFIPLPVDDGSDGKKFK